MYYRHIVNIRATRRRIPCLLRHSHHGMCWYSNMGLTRAAFVRAVVANGWQRG